MTYTCVSWLAIVSTALGVCIAHNLSISLEVTLVYIPFSLLFLTENYRQEVSSTKLVEQMKQLLAENERLAEESRATELRHMIGNVAHDLKTVSPIL